MSEVSDPVVTARRQLRLAAIELGLATTIPERDCADRRLGMAIDQLLHEHRKVTLHEAAEVCEHYAAAIRSTKPTRGSRQINYAAGADDCAWRLGQLSHQRISRDQEP